MNAQGKSSKYLLQPPDGQTTVDDTGGLYVSAETLARFGGGNAKVGRAELRALLAAERDSLCHIGPTAQPLTVRVAGPPDEDDVLALLMMDLEQNAARIAPIDAKKVLDHIQMGTRRRGGIVGVIGRPAVAVVVLIPYQWWWSNGWYWQELVNFVHPDHRKSTHADDLMNFCKWAADEHTKGMGYRWWLLCGVLGAWRVQSKIAKYRRKFWQAGAAFIYPAPPSQGAG